MRRRISVRVLLWSVVGVFVVGMGVHVAHAVQVQRNVGMLLKQAERAVADHQLVKAAGYYHHYLIYEPDDIDTLAKYVQLLEKLPQTYEVRFRTWQLLDQAVRKAPDRQDLRRQLASVQVALGRFNDAIRNLEALLAANPQQAKLEHDLGWCQEAIGEYEKSAATFARAIEKAPGQLESYLLLAELYRDRFDQPMETARLLNQMVTANPKSSQAYLIRARYHRQLKELTEAEADLKRAAELDPADVEILLSTAQLFLDQNRREQARELLKEGLTKHPDSMDLYERLAMLERESGRREEAIAVLAAGLKHNKEAWDLTLLQAELLLEAGRAEEAERRWREVKVGNPGDARSRYYLAELALERGQEADARELLSEIRRIEGSEGTYWRLGQAARAIYLARRGDRSLLGVAQQQLAEAAKQERKWPRIALLQAEVQELNGHPEKALNHYMRAIELGAVRPDVVRRLAPVLVKQGRFVEADRMVRALEEKHALDAYLLKLAAEIALDSLEYERAVKLAVKAVPPGSRDYRDHLWLGNVYRAAGLVSEAEAALRTAVRVAPAIPEVWISLIQHFIRTGQRAEAQSVFTQAAQKLPADRAALALARGHELLGQRVESLVIYEKALAERPNDFTILRALSDFYLRGDEFQRAEPLLRRLITTEVSAPLEVKAQARRQLAVGLSKSPLQGALREALALLERNFQEAGANIPDARARAAIRGTREATRDDAVREFEATVSQEPLTVEEQLWLAELYDAEGLDFRADEVMAPLLVAHPDNPQVLAHQAGRLIRREMIDQARRSFERLVQFEPASRRVEELRKLLNVAASGK